MTRPRLADDHTLLADVAAHLLRQRVEKYPAIVEAGKMTQAEADTGIRLMQAIAARFRMIPLRDLGKRMPEAHDFATEYEIRTTLAQSSARAAQIAAADPTSEKTDYAAAVAAMLWHAERWTDHAQAA